MKTPVTELLERFENAMVSPCSKCDLAIIDGIFPREILKLMKLVCVYMDALEKVHDKRKRDHQEPNEQTEIYCMNHIAEVALDEGEKIASGGTDEKGGGM